MQSPQNRENGYKQLASSLPNIDALVSRTRNKPFIIGVSGGTASGKTSVCDIILKRLENKRVAIISQDSFYKSLSPENLANVHGYNFDHPDAFDWVLLEEVLSLLQSGKVARIPTYNFKSHTRGTEYTTLEFTEVILFEGILAFYMSGVRKYMDLKLFVDTDADTRLARRVIRDIKHRGRDLEGILEQYLRFVKPSFDEYIMPTKKYADVIIPRGPENTVAIDLIVKHIQVKLEETASQKRSSKHPEPFYFEM